MKTLVRWNVGAWAVLVLVASAVMVCGLAAWPSNCRTAALRTSLACCSYRSL